MHTLDSLSFLIHAAEYICTKEVITKRLTSIVTDAFFERSISRHSSLGISTCYSAGWITCTDTKTDTRKWYKLTSGHDNDGRNLCLEFIRKLLALGGKDEFYLIDWNVMSSGMVYYKLKQIIQVPDSYRIASTPRKDLDLIINKNISSRFKFNDIKNVANLDKIKPWLASGFFSLEQLECILATRVFMNFSGIYGFTDIDLLCWIGDQVSVIEFKRKYPTRGDLFTFNSAPANYDSLFSIHDTFVSLGGGALTKCSYEEYPQPGAFGLDESHLKILARMSNTGINYRHVIWDSKSTSLLELLTHDFNLVKPAHIKYSDLDFSSFHGITSAPPKKSGTYTPTSSRAQLMMLESGFISFSIAASGG